MLNRRRLMTLALSCAFVAASLAAMPATAAAQDVERVTVEELKALMGRGEVVVLDVRGGGDTKIKGAHHIPLDQLETRLGELPAGREIVTYCA